MDLEAALILGDLAIRIMTRLGGLWAFGLMCRAVYLAIRSMVGG